VALYDDKKVALFFPCSVKRAERAICWAGHSFHGSVQCHQPFSSVDQWMQFKWDRQRHDIIIGPLYRFQTKVVCTLTPLTVMLVFLGEHTRTSHHLGWSTSKMFPKKSNTFLLAGNCWNVVLFQVKMGTTFSHRTSVPAIHNSQHWITQRVNWE
jgi:hypothetical protein